MGARGEPCAQALGRFRRGVGARDSDRAKAQLERLFAQSSRSFVLPFNTFFALAFTCTRGSQVNVNAGLAIEAKGLFKSFDGKPAVRGIDIAVPDGSIYGISGPQWRGENHHAADAARHHRAGRRASAACWAMSGRSKRRRWSAICPRSAASIRR